MPVSFTDLLEQFTQMVLADRVTDTSELFRYDKLVLGEGDGNGKNYTYFFDINTGELIEKYPYGEGYVVGIAAEEYYKLKVEAEMLYHTLGKIKLLNLTQDENQYVYYYIMSHAKHIYPTKMTPAELYVRAFLSTIKQAEAGLKNPPLKYNSWNGGDYFTEKSYDECPKCYAKHPEENPNTGSSAAGAYQFIQGRNNLWDKFAQLYNIKDFSPKSQDKAAIYKLKEIKLLKLIEQGKFLTAYEYLHNPKHLAWTSFHVLTEQAFTNIYKKYIINELHNNSDIATKQGDLLK